MVYMLREQMAGCCCTLVAASLTATMTTGNTYCWGRGLNCYGGTIKAIHRIPR